MTTMTWDLKDDEWEIMTVLIANVFEVPVRLVFNAQNYEYTTRANPVLRIFRLC